jgi:TolA-binding protein
MTPVRIGQTAQTFRLTPGLLVADPQSLSALDAWAPPQQITKEQCSDSPFFAWKITATMPDTALPLDDLTQQIRQHESELKRLRRQYEERQTQLSKLTLKKETLQSQIQQVEAEIQAVTQGKATPAVAPPIRRTVQTGRPSDNDCRQEITG